MSRSTAVAAPASGAVPAAAEGAPWILAILVALASFMEVLDTTIANVALPYVAGDMGVSQDESSWVVTTYLVANAVILTASSFLARMLGRKRFFLICLAAFTISSVLCGFAWNLDALLTFRILQGLGGGGMVPVAQSILADSFPPSRRGQAFALFGIAVVVAPVVGPTLGGWLADNLSWRWCFLINGPVGVATIALISSILHEAAPGKSGGKSGKNSFDLIGFLLVATFLGSLEIMLDRGVEDDWFGSPFIIRAAVICASAFVLMIPWEMSRANPMIDLRMVATRQFGTCFFVMLAVGIILLGTTQSLPQLVQDDFGYTATQAGLVLSPGGIVAMAMMFITGRLTTKVQPKYLICVGAIITAFSMYQLTNIYADIGFWFFAKSRMLLSIGISLIFLPIMSASYSGIPRDKTDQASALINAARNTGGSIGISIAANILAHRGQFHQNRLVESLIPSSPQYQSSLQQITAYFTGQGSAPSLAHQQAIGWIGQAVQAQSSLLSYIDAYWVLAMIAFAAVPMALSLSKVQLGGPAPSAH